MRIGKFSELNKLSIDAVRHYMDLGLIVPEKQGGQYFFDSKCQKDLEDIMDFKGLGFSLHEIKTLFLYKSFNRLAPDQEKLFYQSFLKEKHDKVEQQIKELSAVKQGLEDRLELLKSRVSGDISAAGIPIRSLDLFCCNRCKGSLVLYDAEVNRNQIMHGRLRCACGEEYGIGSGVLKVGEPHDSTSVGFRNDFVSEYIHETDPAYLDNLYRGLEWSSRRFKLCDPGNKVLLELGTGIGFFLRNIYEELPEHSTYIAVDHSMEKLRLLKSLLEGSGCKGNLLFICADFLEIPVREGAVDILLDFSGTSNYSFEHEEFLLERTDRYIKKNAYLFGAYILFKSFSSRSLIDRKYRDHFRLEAVRKRILSLGYAPLDERTSDCMDRGGKYESYFVEGEKVFTWSFIGKRSG